VTADNPSAAIIAGVEELAAEDGIPRDAIERLGHDTTVATNALMQRRGGTVALVTTKGVEEYGHDVARELGAFKLDLGPTASEESTS
jgi:N-methylhydantoinase A